MKLSIPMVRAGLFAAALLPLAASPASAQNCDVMPAQSDFEVTELGTAPGMAMDIAAAKDGRIFWVERHGAFKTWNPSTKQVTTIHTFDVMSKSLPANQYYLAVETGLQGITLDPDFLTNGWVYLRYTLPASKTPGLTARVLGPTERLARFTLKNNGTQIDLATEKTLLEYKNYAQCCHFGGDLEWGSDGNLWMTSGDNIHYNNTNTNPYNAANNYSDVRSTSANTNDLRGKVLRIKLKRFPDTESPAPGIGSTYDIPEGNLFPVGTASTRPEIYTMGHRNPFSIAIHPDPAKHWLVIGEAGGVDGGTSLGEDEVNVTTKPGFFGWPFWSGNNVPYNQPAYVGSQNPFANAAATPNESPHNTGLKVLPPAIPAAISIRTGAIKLAMNCLGVTWGWIKHDPMLNNKAKWPAFLDGKVLISSYGAADVQVGTVDATGKVTRLDRLFTAQPWTTDVMKAVQGADGAFYIARGDALNFNTSSVSRVYRVAYKGSCFTVSAKPDAKRLSALTSRRDRVANLGNTQVTLPAGIRRVQAYGMDGRLAWTAARSESGREEMRAIPANVTKGMLELRYFAD